MNGGAIDAANNNTIVIKESVFTYDEVTGCCFTAGAVIFADNPLEISLSNTLISNNTNGAVYLKNAVNGKFTLINSTVEFNTGEYGAGIRTDGTSDGQAIFSINNSTIKDNSVTRNGGGLYFKQTTAHITDTMIINNEAELNGGGVLLGHNSTLTLTNVKIQGNKAYDSGPGIACSYTSVKLIIDQTSDQQSDTISYCDNKKEVV